MESDILFEERKKIKRTARPETSGSAIENLLEEIPHQSETDHEIAVGIIWRGQEVIGFRHSGIEVFCFEKNTRLPDPCIDEEIEVCKVTNLFFLLYKKLGRYRIVVVCIKLSEIVERDAGLQIECFFEKII